MNEIPLIFFLWIGAFLFATGLSIILIKRNVIFVLMGVELMLNAANLNLIAFSRGDEHNQGLIMGLFVFGANNTKDFSDVEGDRAGNCRKPGGALRSPGVTGHCPRGCG